MSWLSSLFCRKANPAPQFVVLDDYIIQQLERLVEDAIWMNSDKNFSSRHDVIDFIHDKLELIRPKEDPGNPRYMHELIELYDNTDYIVKPEPSVPNKKIQKNKLKPLTRGSNSDKSDS